MALSTTACMCSPVMFLRSKRDMLVGVIRQLPAFNAIFNSIFLSLDIKHAQSILHLHDAVNIFKWKHPSIVENLFSPKVGIHLSYTIESYNWSNIIFTCFTVSKDRHFWDMTHLTYLEFLTSSKLRKPGPRSACLSPKTKIRSPKWQLSCRCLL